MWSNLRRGGSYETDVAHRQFAQQRLKKGAVIGGWVSSFYLLLPACLTPFIGIYIDFFGQRIAFRKCSLESCFCWCSRSTQSVPLRVNILNLDAVTEVLAHCSYIQFVFLSLRREMIMTPF